MTNKIIELSKQSEENKCLLCCENPATTKVKIKRQKYDEVVTSFCVCDSCFAQMKMDIE